MKAGFLLAGLAALALAGCEQQMAVMPRINPLAASPLFPDGSGARPEPADTVALEAVATPEPPLSAGLLARGRERFDVFCTPCHDYTGHGNGLVVQHGFPRPPDLHDAV